MDETEWERHFLDRVIAILNAHKRDGNRPLVLDIERSIGMVFEGHEPIDPEHWDLYRDVCFAAGEGQDRTRLLNHVRDNLCMGLVLSAAD